MNGSFHLAYATTDLKRIKAFYGKFLGCKEGRSADTWVDYDFFGHQLLPFRSTDPPKDAPLFSPPAGWNIRRTIRGGRCVRRTADGTTYSEK